MRSILQDLQAFVVTNDSTCRRRFVLMLKDHNMIWHFDDPTDDICWSKNSSINNETKENAIKVCSLLDSIVKEIYHDDLFDLAIELT